MSAVWTRGDEGRCLHRIAEAEAVVREAVPVDVPAVWHALARGDRLSDGESETLVAAMRARLAPMSEGAPHGDG